MDVLTDVLSTMRASSVLYARIEASAPWGIRFEVRGVVKFCLVVSGSCCLTMKESEPRFLSEGDFFMTTGGAKYFVSDRPESPSQPVEEVLGGRDRGVSEIVRIGGNGASTTLLNGLVSLDVPDAAYFLKLLPRLILLPQEQAHRFRVCHLPGETDDRG